MRRYYWRAGHCIGRVAKEWTGQVCHHFGQSRVHRPSGRKSGRAEFQHHLTGRSSAHIDQQALAALRQFREKLETGKWLDGLFGRSHFCARKSSLRSLRMFNHIMDAGTKAYRRPHSEPGNYQLRRRGRDLNCGHGHRAALLGGVWLGALAMLAPGTAQAQQGPFAYVPNRGDDNVTVIDTPTNTVGTDCHSCWLIACGCGRAGRPVAGLCHEPWRQYGFRHQHRYQYGGRYHPRRQFAYTHRGQSR